MEINTVSRREFVIQGTQAAVGAIVLGSLVHSCTNPADTNKDPGLSPEDKKLLIDVTNTAYAALAATGGAAFAPIPGSNYPLVVIRISDTEISAVTSVCTHAGCQVNLPTNNVIACPCHGSAFDENGIYISGPALSNLKQYAASISGTLISVVLGKAVTVDTANSAYSALANIGGSAYVNVEGKAKPLIVYRISATEVSAFSSLCTHKGCQVDLPDATGIATCPCHQSKFDSTGAVVSGPATLDLEKFTAAIDGNNIIIDIL